jgi:TRAP-type C4-dicarboxylate transport system permease small subunit
LEKNGMSALELFRDKWNFFDEIVYKVTCAICISLIIIMTFEVLVHVFFRYFLDAPLKWGEELARLMMVWAGLLGIGIALKDKDHVGIELLTRKLSGKTLAWCNLISRIMIIGFVGLVFIWGINLTVESYGTYLPALNISWAWSFLSVPVSAAVQLIFLISSCLQDLIDIF